MNYQQAKEKLKDKIPVNFENIAMHEFGKYDKNSNGHIEGPELLSLLQDMAQFFGFDPNEVENNEFIKKSLLSEIDVDNDKKITFKEFQQYFLMVYSKEHFIDHN